MNFFFFAQKQRADGRISKEDPNNLKIMDRYVSIGDIVQRTNNEGKDTIMQGTVTSLSIFVDVVTKKGEFKNLNCENIKHSHSFQKDQFVILKKGKWVGRIFNTICDVTILFEDGAACIIAEADSSVLKIIGDKQAEENPGEPQINYK